MILLVLMELKLELVRRKYLNTGDLRKQLCDNCLLKVITEKIKSDTENTNPGLAHGCSE
jgi:hypothetical protein